MIIEGNLKKPRRDSSQYMDMKRFISILVLTLSPIGISFICGIIYELDEIQFMLNTILIYVVLIYWRKVDETL